MGAIAKARHQRKRMTPPEARMWVALRALRGEGFHFRRQAPLHGYFADFACLKHRLIVEVDGAGHGTPAQAEHDRIRDAALARHGFRTLRYAAVDIRDNLDGILDLIREALHGSLPPGSASLRPPPPAGEGK